MSDDTDSAEAIVRDLANADPGDGGDGHRAQCTLCGVYITEWAKNDNGEETGLIPISGIAHHNRSCPYRRAVEWVARHGDRITISALAPDDGIDE